MLRHIHVKDFAIIDEISLQFADGFIAFTGETGAGKSILVEALGLTLGDRADPLMVRTGASQSSITATFDPSASPELKAYLSERGLATSDDELILRRIVDTDGKSRAFCNTNTVPLQTLREIGTYLVDVHSQHAHQSLLRRDVQRQLLDHFGDYPEVANAVRDAYDAVRSIRDEVEARRALNPDGRAQELELLAFQLRELEALAPRHDEAQILERDLRRLGNTARITELGTRIQALLSEEEICAEVLLRSASKELHVLTELDPGVQGIAELLITAQSSLDEACTELRHYLLAQDADPAELSRVENRLGALHEVARKHHVAIADLPDRLNALHARMDALGDHAARLSALERQLAAARASYDTASLVLHQQRSAAAQRMGQLISQHMQTLGMPGGRLEIIVQHLNGAEPSFHGADSIEFSVSTNPGQPLRPLAKVASGGELSRISLAIQIVGANDNGVPTLVFDEIDVGIGGGIAEILGRRLRELAARKQILCVTHHAQVAALAQQHYKAKKSIVKGASRPSILTLQGDARVQEIARMLGGVKITDRALAHAREMLEQ